MAYLVQKLLKIQLPDGSLQQMKPGELVPAGVVAAWANPAHWVASGYLAVVADPVPAPEPLVLTQSSEVPPEPTEAEQDFAEQHDITADDVGTEEPTPELMEEEPTPVLVPRKKRNK